MADVKLLTQDEYRELVAAFEDAITLLGGWIARYSPRKYRAEHMADLQKKCDVLAKFTREAAESPNARGAGGLPGDPGATGRGNASETRRERGSEYQTDSSDISPPSPDDEQRYGLTDKGRELLAKHTTATAQPTNGTYDHRLGGYAGHDPQ